MQTDSGKYALHTQQEEDRFSSRQPVYVVEEAPEPYKINNVQFNNYYYGNSKFGSRKMNFFASITGQTEIIHCSDVFCTCQPPQFQQGQAIFAILTFLLGIGLWVGALGGFYGNRRSNCCAVLLAGVFMTATAPCIVGIASGCLVGSRMLRILV